MNYHLHFLYIAEFEAFDDEVLLRSSIDAIFFLELLKENWSCFGNNDGS